MKRLFTMLGSGVAVLILIGLGVALFFTLSGVNSTEETLNESQFDAASASTQAEPTVLAAATATRDVGVFQSPLPRPTEPVGPTPDWIIQPPVCQFEGKAASQPETSSQLDKFVFSDPQVIFSREVPINLIEFLPNSQRLLIHTTIPMKQSIEVLDTTTGQSEVYADELHSANRVHWVAEEQAVVYTENKISASGSVDHFGLWLTQGQGDAPQLLLEAEYDALMRTRENAQTLQAEIAKAINLYDFPFDPEQWRYNKYPQDPYVQESWRDINFASAVSPDGSKAIFYGIPWLYLVDLKTNQPCEVDLGHTYHTEQGPLRVFDAFWSPDGKLLAMQTAVGFREQDMYFNNLVILNTVTGELYRPETQWSHIWDVAWFPDSRHLVVMGYSNEVEQPQLNQQIGIIDSLTQEFRLILPDQVFAKGALGGFQLALSPDGKKLMVNCPIVSDKYPLGAKGQICVISIN